MDTTLDMLDEIGYLIKEFRGAYEDEGSLFGEEVTNIRRKLNFAIQDALDAKLISPKMAQEYIDVIHEIDSGRAGYDDTVDRIERLKEICNRQTEDYTQYDEKTDRAFDLSHSLSLVGLGDKVENSKTVLQNIQQLMTSYEQMYTKDDALAAGDALCAVGKALQQGVTDKKIETGVAEKLVDVLKAIKENAFNDNIHQGKIQEFMVVLDSEISGIKENKKEKQTETKKKEEEKKPEPKKEEKKEPEQVKPNNKFNFFNLGKKKKQEPEQKPEEEQKQEPDKTNPEEEKTEEQKHEPQLQEKPVHKKEELQKPERSKANLENEDHKDEITEEKALDDLYRLLGKYQEVYQRHQDGGNRPETREVVLNAFSDLIGAYTKYKSKHLFSSQEMSNDFQKEIRDVFHREQSISNMRNVLQKAIYENANRPHQNTAQTRRDINLDDVKKVNDGQIKKRQIAPQDWFKGIKNLEQKKSEQRAEHVNESKFREGIENVNDKGDEERRKKEMLKRLLYGKNIQNE